LQVCKDFDALGVQSFSFGSRLKLKLWTPLNNLLILKDFKHLKLGVQSFSFGSRLKLKLWIPLNNSLILKDFKHLKIEKTFAIEFEQSGFRFWSCTLKFR